MFKSASSYLAVLGALCGVVTGFSNPVEQSGRTVAGSLEYYNYEGGGVKGDQLYLPVEAVYPINDFTFGVKTGQVWSSTENAGVKGAYTGLIDTTVHSAWSPCTTACGKTNTFVFVDLNLPTGKSALSASQDAAIQDPNFVAVERFGEGFNVRPGFVYSIPVDVTGSLSVGAAYNHRGDYSPDATDTSIKFKPGHQSDFTIDYKESYAGTKVSAGAKFTYNYDASVNGEVVSKQGSKVAISILADHPLSKEWSINAAATVTGVSKNEYQNTLAPLQGVDALNERATIYNTSLAGVWSDGKKCSVSLAGEYVYQDGATLDVQSLILVPNRTRYGATLSVKHKLSDRLSLNAAVSVRRTSDDATSITPSAKYDSQAYVVGMSASF